eukprot:NODE_865_length_3602_cov_0.156437.p1 type:complete len:373 gc:universal NODE_865_length_3602_cov_0.156437:2382-3500(+)
MTFTTLDKTGMNPKLNKIFKFLKKIYKMLDKGDQYSSSDQQQSAEHKPNPAVSVQDSDGETPEKVTQASKHDSEGNLLGDWHTATDPTQKIATNSFVTPDVKDSGASMGGKPSKNELTNSQLAMERLWDLDINRRSIKFNRQGKTTITNRGDKARGQLFDNLDLDQFPVTFKLFASLLDNYTPMTGTAENQNTANRNEQKDFILAVLKTPVGSYLAVFLDHYGVKNHLKYLLDLWFQPAKRDVYKDSSPFEHVFVGEIRDSKVIGMHNWIQLYYEEKAGALDYQGYLPCKHNSEYLANIQFTWHNYMKQVSTLFIGTSPEFEISLYTLAYLFLSDSKNESVFANFDCVPIKITVHTYGNGKIGGAYPEIVRQ